MVYTISNKIIDREVMAPKFTKVKSDPETTFEPQEKWRIWRNVLVLGFAFMVHFTAFWGASNLQSSVNADEALGTSTLAAIYGSLLISNILLPSIIIKWLGCKWTMTFSFIAFMPFIASQFYPRFYTMIPSGLFVGLGGGPLWCAKCTFLTVVAEAYSQITGVASDVIVTRFFGVFFMFYQLSQVWGNLISSAVLSSGAKSSADLLSYEATTNNWTNAFNLSITTPSSSTYEDVEAVCGANFCPGVAAQVNPNLEPPPSSKINIISGIYLACMVIACLVVAFGVDSMKRYQKRKVTGNAHSLSGLKLLAVTLKQLANPYQLLILPITMFIGAEQAFLAADYNASFVSCGWGISNIGFVMICFGVSNAIAALAIGGLTKKLGRGPMMAFALLLHVGLLVTLLIWRPHPEYKYAFFAISGFWGVCDAIWLVQINSLYGILFPGKKEPAYSNFRLWESTGSVITYAYSPYLCTRIKIYLLIGLLFIGVLGYTAVEFLEYRNRNEHLDVARGKFELVKSKQKKQEIAE